MLAATVAFFPPSCDGDKKGESPPERSGVVLELDRTSAAPGDTLELTVHNLTRTRLEYGVAYRLELRTGDDWRWVNRDAAFILILKVAEPGAREREQIQLGDLEPGRYRIVKSFTAPATGREIRGEVELEIR